MVSLGYFLSSEERDPRELADGAIRAEQAGFSSVWISDHFHPWTDAQGQSAFVWSTIGAIAARHPGHIAESVPAGPDPEKHLAKIRAFADAGYDEVYVAHIGPDQPGMIDFYEKEILPNVP